MFRGGIGESRSDRKLKAKKHLLKRRLKNGSRSRKRGTLSSIGASLAFAFVTTSVWILSIYSTEISQFNGSGDVFSQLQADFLAGKSSSRKFIRFDDGRSLEE